MSPGSCGVFRSPSAKYSAAETHARLLCSKPKCGDAKPSLALRFIVSELSPYEWRDLQGLLQQRTFQFDILPSLPTELINLVLRHLEPEELFPLRRVSKSWQRILCAEEICSSALQYQFPEIRSSNDRISSDLILLEKEARRWHAFKIGRAFGSASYRHNVINSSSNGARHRRKVSYHAGKLAWIETDSQTGGHSIIVRLLGGQSIFGVKPANRGRLVSVVIGKTLLAAVSLMGRVHVWDHAKFEEHHFRLPSAVFQDINIKDRTVGLLLQETVLLYDFDSQSSHEVRLSRASHNYTLLLLHPREESVVVFFHSYESMPSSLCRIGFERYAYNGALLSTGSVQSCFYGINSDCLWSIQPCDHRGSYCVQASLGWSSIACPHPTKYVEGVQFDSRTNQLCTIELPGYYDCLLWKGIAYTLNVRYDRENIRRDGETGIFLTNLNDQKGSPTAKEAELSQLWSSIMEHERPYSSRQGCLYGDDNFLVRQCGGELDVWRFAEDCTMLDENEDFRIEMIAKTGRNINSQTEPKTVVPMEYEKSK